MIASYLLFSDSESKARSFFLAFHVSSFFLLEVTDYRFLYRFIVEPVYLMLTRFTVIASIFLILGYTVKFYSDLTNFLKLSSRFFQKSYHISDRESELIPLVLEGKANKEIGLELFIEEDTVKKHLQNIYRKMNVKNRAALMALLNQ